MGESFWRSLMRGSRKPSRADADARTAIGEEDRLYEFLSETTQGHDGAGLCVSKLYAYFGNNADQTLTWLRGRGFPGCEKPLDLMIWWYENWERIYGQLLLMGIQFE